MAVIRAASLSLHVGLVEEDHLATFAPTMKTIAVLLATLATAAAFAPSRVVPRTQVTPV